MKVSEFTHGSIDAEDLDAQLLETTFADLDVAVSNALLVATIFLNEYRARILTNAPSLASTRAQEEAWQELAGASGMVLAQNGQLETAREVYSSDLKIL